MPSPELILRYDPVVYWALVKRDAYDEPLLAAPVQIQVRWVNSASEVTAPNGTTVATSVRVVLGQDVVIGSIMYKGKLASLGSPPTPSGVDLFQVMGFDPVLDVKNRFTGRTARLARFNRTLPALA